MLLSDFFESNLPKGTYIIGACRSFLGNLSKNQEETARALSGNRYEIPIKREYNTTCYFKDCYSLLSLDKLDKSRCKKCLHFFCNEHKPLKTHNCSNICFYTECNKENSSISCVICGIFFCPEHIYEHFEKEHYNEGVFLGNIITPSSTKEQILEDLKLLNKNLVYFRKSILDIYNSKIDQEINECYGVECIKYIKNIEILFEDISNFIKAVNHLKIIETTKTTFYILNYKKILQKWLLIHNIFSESIETNMFGDIFVNNVNQLEIIAGDRYF